MKIRYYIRIESQMTAEIYFILIRQFGCSSATLLTKVMATKKASFSDRYSKENVARGSKWRPHES